MEKKKNIFLLAFVAVIFFSVSLFAAAQLTDPNEVKALQSIRGSLGDSLGNLNGWDDGDPCTKSWRGVICNSNNDGYLHVQTLELLNLEFTGTLAPEIGQLQQLEILNFMWNKITGSIPEEIGNITTLRLLLLSGNSLSGSLPERIGYLPNLDRLQIDENNISGSIPKSFANLTRARHFHMNNNSISGEIPMEFSNLSSLVHLLLDNNNLTGKLPPQLSEMPNLRILQLDNNHFTGHDIPSSYTKMEKLLKLSLRNCGLHGSLPNFSSIPELGYLDLSHNNLTGEIPSARLSANITTIDLSYNNLIGMIPSSFADLPQLQRLLLDNNELNGSVPAIGLNVHFGSNATLFLDFQNNKLANISDFSMLTIPNITMWLNGNPLCSQENQIQIAKSCATQNGTEDTGGSINKITCPPDSCPPDYEYIPENPYPNCYCVAPFEVGIRLKSPGLSYFPPYRLMFEEYLTSGLNLKLYQLCICNYIWEPGPRLAMNLKFFPLVNEPTRKFNASEIQRIHEMFAGWKIGDSDIFGPREWINITLEGPYASVNLESGGGSSLSKGALAGVLVGTILGTIAISFVVIIMIMKQRTKHRSTLRKKLLARKRVKIAGVKDFDFTEMASATNNFSVSMQVGQGGYGRVYKGMLADGTIVAIKRAQEGSLQGEHEFSTEIDFLSRVHHLNLVSLVGYCDDEGEQMLVYEYMANGTVREHLSESSKKPLNFSQRVRIALGAARGILYLHNEANPPIFHRDIKASNILLDHRFNARVADFGLSKLAPVPDLEGSAPGHVSTVVKGTPGYLDPEYFFTHKLTDKSDVYSFGVVLLELLTGMQPISHGKNIVREVNMAYESGMILSMIDPRMGSYPSECLEPFASLALRCCKNETDARPSMAEVVHALEKILQFTSGVDTTSMQSVKMDALLDEKLFTSKTSSQNPYVSSNVLGSDLISGTIPDIAPR